MGVGFSDGTSYADQGEWLAHSNPIPEEVKRIYITPGTSTTNTEMPLGSTEKPADALKPTEGTPVPGNVGNTEYDTKLTPEEETKFTDWKQQNAPNDSGADYDLRGAFKAGLSPAENKHFPDTYKKPSHPTFSTESVYSDETNQGGSWGRIQGNWTFTPSDLNLKYHGKEGIQDYLSKSDPSVILLNKEQQGINPLDITDPGRELPTPRPQAKVIFKTKTGVEITDHDIEDAMNVALSSGIGAMDSIKSVRSNILPNVIKDKLKGSNKFGISAEKFAKDVGEIPDSLIWQEYEALHQKMASQDLNLNPNQKWAVGIWGDPKGYKAMNESLRGGAGNSYIKENISQLDSAIASSTLKEPTILWRGIHGPHAANLKDLKPGAVFSNEGYTATTIDPRRATHYSAKHDDGIVINYHMPEGSNALYTSHPQAGGWSEAEREVLLPHGIPFRIVSKEKIEVPTWNYTGQQTNTQKKTVTVIHAEPADAKAGSGTKIDIPKKEEDFETTLKQVQEALGDIQGKGVGHFMDPADAANKWHEIYAKHGTKAAIQFEDEYGKLATSKQMADFDKHAGNPALHPDSPFFGGYKQGKVPINEYEQIPFGYSKGEWDLMSPYQKKKVLDSPGEYPNDPIKPDWENELTGLLKEKTPKGWNSVEEMAMTPYKAPPLTAKEKIENQVKEIQNMLFNSSLNERVKAYQKAHRENIPEEALKQGYTEPAYKGIHLEGGQGSEVNPNYHYGSQLYSSDSPLLADMYTSYLSAHPGWQVNPSAFQEGATVAPLLINTKNYHVYDAKGGHWADHNNVAIKEARAEGKDGVIVRNVWDEPNSTKSLPTSATVYITLERGASSVKSRFAERFDKSSANMMHMIPVIGVGGATGYVSMKDAEAK